MNKISTLTLALACSAIMQSPPADAQELRGQVVPGMPAASSAPAADENVQGLFVAPLNGIGLNADRARGYGAGLRLSPQSGAYVGYQMGNLTIGSALHQEDEAERATWLDMGASYGLNLSRKHRISVDGGISVRTPGDSTGENNPFGFRADDTVEPGAGFRLSWRYNFGRNHYVSTILGFDHRFGASLHEGPDAERSATTFGTVYGYRFY